MSDRLPTGILVSALLRRVNDSGGMAAVVAKGNAQGGGVLVVILDRAGSARVFERGIGPAGQIALIESTPSGSVDDYWRRRRARDPDLWVIELDSPQAERFAAETMLVN
ncbi:DUF1491 family protein [Sphingomonas sp.]|uniref:DUF1491 family protein n=1 Tax=Sphingomonas sp. TaxID=28214 RepID=UPI002EDB9FBD